MADILHKTCIICGAKYDTPRNNPRKTCSDACAHEARSRINKGKTPASALDVTGRTYGELTAIRRIAGNRWLWRCSCGKEVEVELRNVRNDKRTISCGHVSVQNATKRIADGVLGDYDGTRISTLESISRGKIRSSNTSGATGVRIRPRKNGGYSYSARIMLRGKQITIGTFDSFEAAVAARKAAEKKYFGEVIEAYNRETK